MKKLSGLLLIFTGFVAGVTFISSCGGGGSNPSSANAADPPALWPKQLTSSSDDKLYSISKSIDGGYYICGETNKYVNAYSSAHILKLDQNLDISWEHGTGAILAYDICPSIVSSADGSHVYTTLRKNRDLSPSTSPTISKMLDWPNSSPGAREDDLECRF